MDISGPVAIFLFFLLLLVDMFFYGFDAAIDNLNEKEILHKAEEERIAGRCGFLRWSAVRGSISIRYS